MNRFNDALYRHADYYLNRLRELDDTYLQEGQTTVTVLAEFDQDWSQILKGQHWASERKKSDSDAAILCSDYPNAGVHLLALHLSPHDRIIWYQQGMDTIHQFDIYEADTVYLP